jgi:hypothetical protein
MFAQRFIKTFYFTLERGKMGMCMLLAFVQEHSTLFTSGLTMVSYFLHIHKGYKNYFLLYKTV